MRLINKIILVFSVLLSSSYASANPCDVVVVGGTASGVGAAVSASREGKEVCLITRVKKTEAMGGMITSGLNFSDSGLPVCKPDNADVPDYEKCSHVGLTYDGVIPHKNGYELTSGLFDEFRKAVKSYYDGKNLESWNGIRHEPSIASNIIADMLKNTGIYFYKGYVVSDVVMSNGKIDSINIESIDDNGRLSGGVNIKGDYFIDATITGDLAEKSGVGMTIGRESTETYKEGFAGELYWNPKKNKFLDATPLTSRSDEKLQAYSYFLTVKKENAKSVVETDVWKALVPDCSIYKFDGAPDFLDSWAKNGWSPGEKYFEVNVHPKGSDLQGGNYNYHAADWNERVDVENAHKKRALCFIKFWQDKGEGSICVSGSYPNSSESKDCKAACPRFLML
ncbi:FAD-dependent oxidoreductase [Thiothrix nivea]|uniref:FAD-dependent oxidoreductase n=1 Tax=Thiothrix nivea TaxID=1031 RepID=UPI0002F5C292|nr:FAD-dependent oxidoreductase [Thiothrix nivea]